jgi:hypothetical protein
MVVVVVVEPGRAEMGALGAAVETLVHWAADLLHYYARALSVTEVRGEVQLQGSVQNLLVEYCAC